MAGAFQRFMGTPFLLVSQADDPFLARRGSPRQDIEGLRAKVLGQPPGATVFPEDFHGFSETTVG